MTDPTRPTTYPEGLPASLRAAWDSLPENGERVHLLDLLETCSLEDYSRLVESGWAVWDPFHPSHLRRAPQP